MRAVQLRIEAWQALSELAMNTAGFIFRGQADAAWPLETSIERAMRRYDPGVSHIEYSERWALHEFRAKYHLYANTAPHNDDRFEWLALLQHHGFPTRLLDFTHSIYVACHFAAAQATSTSAVWCVSNWAVRDNLHRAFELPYTKGKDLKDRVNEIHREFLNECLGSESARTKPYLVPVESARHSHRLARQQGLFLAPTTFGSIGERFTFEDSLRETFGGELPFEEITLREFLRPFSPAEEFAIVKVLIPPSLLPEILRQLEAMSLTEEALFPDLDGLARSLVLKHIRK